MRIYRKLAVALLVCGVCLAGAAEPALANHFRGGHISWQRLSGNTVRFTSVQEWRADNVNTQPINPGDGDPTIIGPVTTLFTGTDTAGESYRIVSYTVDHAYAGAGPFTVFLGNLNNSLNCCRLLSPINAGGDDYRIETVVDLRNGNLGSPATTIPPVATAPRIVRMPQGTLNVSRDLGPGISDPDSAFTCSLASTVQSGMGFNPVAGGNPLMISPACVLSWNTTSTAVGEKYMVQVEILENHMGNLSPVAVDFILEIVAPVCGDGAVNQASEDCDGADDSTCPGDCLSSCKCPVCGDNSINQSSEQCDGTAGGVLGPCPGDCRPPASSGECLCPVCGDGIADAAQGEQCDGSDDSACPGACQSDCSCGVCGDNAVNAPGEECDGIDDPACPGACRASCVCAVCGDGILDAGAGEQCDGSDDSACPGLCTGACTCPVCGNNIAETAEGCDGTDDAACPGACRPPDDPNQCQCPLCGDGDINQGSEQCDGADDAACPGACLALGDPNQCRCPMCGDGDVNQGSEQCDGTDDSACPGDCLSDCTCAICGDGSVQSPIEQCDGSNDSACPGNCRPPGDPNQCACAVCGDGDVNQGSEQCDGADDAACPGACLALGDPNQCRCPICGDDDVNRGGEQCDGTDDSACPGLCRSDCTCTVCGDNSADGPEGCDGDDDAVCPGACLAPGDPNQCQCPVCGDDDVNQGSEACDGLDDGACPGDCLTDCSCALCGDGVAESPAENCDGVDDTACPGQCLPPGDVNECHCPACGDGDVNQTGEECDDGSANSETLPDACRVDCTLPVCGDGVADPGDGEECDPPSAEICNNRIDDDGDSLTDCEDIDCPTECQHADGSSFPPPDVPKCTAQRDCRKLDPDSRCVGIASCGTDCTNVFACEPIGPDPSQIRFDADGPDRFKMHARFTARTPLDPAADGLSLLLTNVNGDIYRASLFAGDLEARGGSKTRFRFIDRGARDGNGIRDGLYKVGVRTRTIKGEEVWTFKIKAYGDFSAATLPIMTTQVAMGNDGTAVRAEWKSTRHGWRLTQANLK